MITCPSCKHENLEGALICEACSQPLHARRSAPTKTFGDSEVPETLAIPRSELGVAEAKVAPEQLPDDLETPRAVAIPGEVDEFLVSARLVIDLDGDTIEHTIAIQDRIVIGRVDHRTDFLPDLNLARYAAWEKGVSRLHAAINREGDQLFLVDLASTNGTYLNGERLDPREPHLLRDGDRICLGLFELRIYYQYPTSSEGD